MSDWKQLDPETRWLIRSVAGFLLVIVGFFVYLAYETHLDEAWKREHQMKNVDIKLHAEDNK